MKRFLMVLGFVFAGSVAAAPQESALKAFQQEHLKSMKMWFSAARLAAGGVLQLETTEEFLKLPVLRKQVIVKQVMEVWREVRGAKGFEETPLVALAHPFGGELWGWNASRERAVRLEDWNVLTQAPLGASMRTGRFFFYLGFGMRAVPEDGASTLTLNFNPRAGTYFYKDKLDLSFSFDFGSTMTFFDTGASSSTGLLGFGVLSRYHFPLGRNSGFGGSVGGEFDFQSNFSEDFSSSNTQAFLLVGASRFFNGGSFDVSAKIGDTTTFLAGLTFFIQSSSGAKRKAK